MGVVIQLLLFLGLLCVLVGIKFSFGWSLLFGVGFIFFASVLPLVLWFIDVLTGRLD